MEEETIENDKDTDLYFINLPSVFHYINLNLVPASVRDHYNPESDPQVLILGGENALRNYRETAGMDEDEYPIQESKAFGTHIDVYGRESVDKYIPHDKLISFKQYRASRKHVHSSFVRLAR